MGANNSIYLLPELPEDEETALLQDLAKYFQQDPTHNDDENPTASALQHLEKIAREARFGEARRRIRAFQFSNYQKYQMVEALLQYRNKRYNVAVTGMSGTGKSSFVNSIRALAPFDPRAKRISARVGSSGETTMVVKRYPYPDDRFPIDIWDLPGAGTRNHPIVTVCERLKCGVIELVKSANLIILTSSSKIWMIRDGLRSLDYSK
jgi:GTP-binding protein EngB required for normal cell division